MLEPLIKRQKNKKLQRANELIKKGLSQLEVKEFKQATITLTLALEESDEEVLALLSAEFEKLKYTNKFEAIRSIGLVLLKKRHNDHELLNTLGNCCRQLQVPKEANHFYRQALKANKAYTTAFHNLAASLANVELYDDDVVQAIRRFEHNEEFYLPEFKNKVQLTGQEDYDNTCQWLRRSIKENWKNRSISEGRQVLQHDIFNLGLYALANKDAETALENLEKLKQQHSEIEHLDMLIALTQALNPPNLEESIRTLGNLLRDDPENRLLNGNLGLLYKKAGNQLLSAKCFLICHDLLKRFDGYFTIEALIQAADCKNKERDYKHALRLYRIAAQESEDPDVWEKLANLLFKLNEPLNALKACKQVLRLKPDSVAAKEKLHLIFNGLIEKAEALLSEKKLQQAAVVFERALLIERSPKLLETTAEVYRSLRQFEKTEDLLQECREIQAREKRLELEKERQVLIEKGKEHSKRKEFTAAIENLEQAARIKLDKDVFMHLAHLYKGLRHTRALQDLLGRWHHLSKPEMLNPTEVKAE